MEDINDEIETLKYNSEDLYTAEGGATWVSQRRHLLYYYTCIYLFSFYE